MFIINLTYKKPLPHIEELLPEHIKFLNYNYDKGNFLCSGRKNPRNGGIILCNAADITHVNNIIKNDPFYQDDAAQYDIIEFEPTKYSTAFAAYLSPNK